MKGLMILITIITTFSCVQQNVVKKTTLPEDNWTTDNACLIKQNLIGLIVEENQGEGCLVTYVASPSIDAGIKVGDILLSIDSILLEKRIVLLDHLQNVKLGQEVNLKFKKNGKIATVAVKPNQGDRNVLINSLLRLLFSGKKVYLAVVTGKITNAAMTNLEQHRLWEQANIAPIIASIQNPFISTFKPYQHFKIVERAKFQKIVEEMALMQSGLLNTNIREKFKLAGATHILSFDLSRFLGLKKTIKDIYSYTIIEIKGGQTIAACTQTVTINY